MLAYYVIRHVDRGTPCSYPQGRTLINCVFAKCEDAQDAIYKYNTHVGVRGIFYTMFAHDETDAFPHDKFDYNECSLRPVYVDGQIMWG